MLLCKPAGAGVLVNKQASIISLKNLITKKKSCSVSYTLFNIHICQKRGSKTHTAAIAFVITFMNLHKFFSSETFEEFISCLNLITFGYLR